MPLDNESIELIRCLRDALQYSEQWIVDARNIGCSLKSEQTLKMARQAISKADLHLKSN